MLRALHLICFLLLAFAVCTFCDALDWARRILRRGKS